MVIFHNYVKVYQRIMGISSDSWEYYEKITNMMRISWDMYGIFECVNHAPVAPGCWTERNRTAGCKSC